VTNGRQTDERTELQWLIRAIAVPAVARKKHITLNLVKHIVNVFLINGEATQALQGMGKLHPSLDEPVAQRFIKTSGIKVNT